MKTFRAIAKAIRDNYTSHSISAYSQEGEDMILRRFFSDKRDGFYIDVGSYHPRRFSNSYYFYRKGWSGLTIDAAPGVKSLFDRARPRDINIQAALSKDGRELNFRTFNEPAFNTFIDDNVRVALAQGYYVIEEWALKTSRLAEILIENVRSEIDFMSIDVEGMDLEVLQGNDWGKFRPKIVLVETFGSDVAGVLESPTHAYMASIRYILCAKTINTAIYRAEETGR